MYQYVLILLVVSLSVFCDLAQLQSRVMLCRCTLYAKPHMYTYMTYVYRISTMSLCTLHQYQTVSVCYDLTQEHKEYQQSTILSFRSLFCTLSRSCACLLISDLQRPESSTCMHMWAQAIVQQVHPSSHVTIISVLL